MAAAMVRCLPSWIGSTRVDLRDRRVEGDIRLGQATLAGVAEHVKILFHTPVVAPVVLRICSAATRSLRLPTAAQAWACRRTSW